MIIQFQETDGPYMAPKSVAGGRSSTCHPGLVPHIAEQIARIKETDLAEVYQIIR